MKPVQLSTADIKPIRETLTSDQGGICPLCRRELTSPCLDHEHSKRIGGSGLVRGVICKGCNSLLGKIENNCRRYGIQLDGLPVFLANTALYLQKEPHEYIHPSEKIRKGTKRKGKKKKKKKGKSV